MQSLKSTDLPFHKLTRWFCTHVDITTGHLFCHLAEPSIAVKYERLEQQISGWDKAGRLEIKAVQPTVGELVLAKYAVDNQWYRSQITEIDFESSEVQVFFLDYGNTETVPFSELREMSSPLSILPAHAVECVLAEIEPFSSSGRWSEKAIDLLKNLVLDQELPGIAVSLQRNGMIVILKLYADQVGKVTVAEQLVAAGFGQAKSHKPSSSCSSSIVRSNSVSSLSSAGSSKQSKHSSSSSKSVKAFKNMPLGKEQYINVCVVYSEGITRFFCQSVSFKNDIDNLQEKIQTICNSNKSRGISGAQVNQICCAKFADDEMFYRAVIKTLQGDSCNVFFVDYGNSASVGLNDIREVDQELLQLPALAIECFLSGIQPLNGNEYSTEANGKFDELTADKNDMLALVNNIDKGRVELILYDDDDVPIAEKLAKNNLVTLLNNKNSSANVSSAKSDSTSRSQAGVKIKYMSLDLTKGQEYPVFVSYIYSPHYFYVNHGNSTEIINKLMADLQVVYTNEKHSPLPSLEIGQPCVCKFIEDDQFYRCQVQSIDKESANVLYVDYGNTDTVPLTEVLPLRKEFIKLNKQAAACKLSGVEPANGEFSIDAKESFEHMVLDKTLTMTVNDIKDGLFQVSLKEIRENNEIANIDVSKALLIAGHAQEPFHQVSSTDVNKYGNQIRSEDKTYADQRIEVDSFVDVVPIVIVDPGNFCCHLTRNAQPFKEMTSHLNEYYSKTSPEVNVSWLRMMPCVALYDEDNCWYRATILAITKDAVEVVFVDFGNSATVKLNNLRLIHEFFMKLPSQIIVCALSDIKPANRSWTDEAAEAFETLVFEKQLACHIKECASSNVCSVLIYDTKSTPEINVGQWLIEKKHAISSTTQEKMLCQTYPVVENTEKVFVTSVNGFNEFYVQLSRLSSELDTMMNDIHSYYSTPAASKSILTKPIIGQYCCAKFSQDDGFYRAKIEEVDGNNVGIFYCDYGNAESLNSNSLMTLTSAFESTYSFAIPCKLSGVNQNGDVTQHELINDKEFEAVFLNKEPPYEVDLKVGGRSIIDDVKALFGGGKREQPAVSIPPADIQSQKADAYYLEAQTLKLFFCQLVSGENELNELMENIAAHVGSGPQATGKVNGGYCLAKYAVDEGWYRALIKEQTAGKLRVFYCDYGNEDSVDASMILEIPQNFAKLPQQAVPCTLFGLSTVSNQDALLEALNTQCSNEIVSLNVRGKNPDGVFEVEVHLNSVNIASPFLSSSDATTNAVPPPSTPSSNQPEVITVRVSEIQANTKEQGVCYVVDAADTIRCQLSKYEQELNVLMNDIDARANSLPQLENPKKGDTCIAKYSEDGGWYRAVVNTIDSDTVSVEFIDYGNSDKVAKSDVKQMPKDFSQLAQCCVTVHLHDVHLADLDEKQAKLYVQGMIEKSCTIEVIEASAPNKVSAYVYEEGSETHVNDKLYETSAIEEDEGPDVIIEDNGSTEEVSAKSPATAEVHKIQMPEISPGTTENTTCFVVSSATEMRCQLSKYETELDALMNELAQEGPSFPVLQNPIKGAFCIAKYSVDEGWYRGCIVECGTDYLVEFIDFGNTDKVPPIDIKQISSKHTKLCQTCISVKLHDVHVEDINVNATKNFLDGKLEQVLRVEIVEKLADAVVSAYVYDEGRSDHINDEIYENFALAEETPENTVPQETVETAVEISSTQAPEESSQEGVPIQNNSSESVSEGKPLTIQMPEISAGTTENATCFVVSSATEMRCQLSKYETELDALMNELGQEGPSCPVLENPTKGAFCIAKYSVDEGWYRGCIVECGTDYQVEFIDFGNTDKVPPSDIKQISSKYIKLRQTCISVKLHDVHVEDIDVNAAKNFLDEKLEQVIRVEIVEKLGDTTVSAYVYDEGRSDHINDLIYENYAPAEETSENAVPQEAPEINAEMSSLQAPKESSQETAPVQNNSSESVSEGKSLTIQMPEISTGATENATCFVVSSTTEMRCQLSKYEAELDALMIELGQEGPSCPVLQNPIKGAFCIAKYSVDEGWYRGCIVECGSDFQVEFIDFGNTDKVPPSDIKQISSKYAKLCQTCISVKLHDVHVEDIDVNAAKNFLDGKLEHTIRVEIVEKLDGAAVSAYVYDEGRSDHINDQIYELFALPEEAPEHTVEGSTNEVYEELSPESVPAQDKLSENSSEGKPLDASAATPKEEIAASSPPPPKVTINYPELKVGVSENAYCTFVESAVVLKCQLSKYEDKIETLPILLTAHASNNIIPESVAVGDYCIAKYTSDGCWYRAQVTKENTPDISVEFIDYGNNDIVKLNDLRSMTKEIADLPRTCIDVQLHNVHVTDIDIAKAKEWLEANLTDQLLTLDIVNVQDNITEAYVVVNGLNVNDNLYELFEKSSEEHVPASTEIDTEQAVDLDAVAPADQHSEEMQTSSSQPAVSEASEIVSETSQENISKKDASLEEQPQIQNSQLEKEPAVSEEAPANSIVLPKFPQPSIDSYDGVMTCTYVDPSEFVLWCRPSKYDAYIEQISVILSREPDSAAESIDTAHIKPGDALITKSEFDGIWYRSEVLEVTDKKQVKVRHVDFGSSEAVSGDSISQMKDDTLLAEPATSFSCHLQDVFEDDIDVEKAKAWLQEKLEEASITLDANADENNVRSGYAYFANNRAVSINDQIYELFSKGEANQESSSTNETPAQVSDNNQGGFIQSKIAVGSSEKAYCTVVDSATILRCQLTKFTNDLEALMQYIANVGESLECLPKPKVGQACIAPFHQDLALYRGRILSVSDATSKVEFVDYGNIDDVINEDFKIIEEKMMSQPLFCLTCQLSNISVLPEHENEAIEYLNRVLVESSEEITLRVDDFADERYHVTVFHNDVDINKHVKEEYGDWECVYRPTDINLGDKVNIQIPTADSLGKFWCQIKDHSEKLGNLMQNISSAYEKIHEPLPEFTTGNPCCALNENNNTYYRAVIEEDLGAELLLRYVDYGVVESVPKTNAFVLQSRFFKLPTQAFEASLFDLQPFKESSSFSEEAVSFFNKKCDSVTLSATVVSRAGDSYALALVLPNGDTLYELLTENQLAKPGNRLSSPVNTPIITNGH